MATIIPVPVIDADGITMPEYANVHEAVRGLYRDIYGQDIYIEPDSQDGQFLAIFSLVLHDAFSVSEAVYNAFSPSTAQGVGLSRVVKINGIQRQVASFSTVDLRIVGQVGTIISSGVVRDDKERRWLLPFEVVIPVEGEIIVTATASEVGAWTAPPGTITVISTPTRGWQTVSNPSSAVPGAPVESDLALRTRQTVSTSLPSVSVLEGSIGAIANLPSVTRYSAAENDTNIIDDRGIPAHSVAFVVEGGDAAEIARTILKHKTPGTGTHGTTVEVIEDDYGIPHTIKFFRNRVTPIQVVISLKAFAGYTAIVEQKIRETVCAWINALPIGGRGILLTRLYVPANLDNGPMSNTFEITSILIAKDADTPTAADIPFEFYWTASCDPASVLIAPST
jgi:uncharacterized phage protein gp47/JayE